MSEDKELDDMLALPSDEPTEVVEVLVDEAPKSRPMGDAARALLERSRSYPANAAAKKNTPERFARILSYAAEMPVASSVALRAGISYTTLLYWLQKSKEGAQGDGFDIAQGEADESDTPDNTVRFHIAFDRAMTAGVEKVEVAVMRRAVKYLEPLTYQGRVQYKYDPQKLSDARLMGTPEFVAENYMLDEFGAPVPETVEKQDPDLAMFVLKARHKDYNPKSTIDVNVRGGVLVVPMRALAPEDLNVIEEQDYKRGRELIEFEDDDIIDEGGDV